MEKITQIKQYADQLRLTQLRNRAESIIHSAQIDKPTYLDYMGPSGTGKSYIAAGLVHEAINKGYRAYFTTMEALDDEVLATALLDRILYHCEVIKLEGNSYRMENRKNILSKKEINMD